MHARLTSSKASNHPLIYLNIFFVVVHIRFKIGVTRTHALGGLRFMHLLAVAPYLSYHHFLSESIFTNRPCAAATKFSVFAFSKTIFITTSTTKHVLGRWEETTAQIENATCECKIHECNG